MLRITRRAPNAIRIRPIINLPEVFLDSITNFCLRVNLGCLRITMISRTPLSANKIPPSKKKTPPRIKRSGLGLNIPIISIAKSNKKSRFLKYKYSEDIYIVSQNIPIRLQGNSLALHFIQRIRDEAHRFALAYHHILRRKKVLGK